MKQATAKSISLFRLIFVGLLLPALIVVSCTRSHTYYAVVDGPLEIQEGAPVLIDSVETGTIQKVMVDSGMNRQVLEVSLSGEYSIPTNSRIEVFSGIKANQGYLVIDIVASRDYYQAGDTIFHGGASGSVEASASTTGDPNFSGSIPVYKIQILATSTRVEADAGLFEGLDPVEEIVEDGIFKYYTGAFGSHADAAEYRKKIVDKGLADVFIVCFLDGERISIQEAMQFEK
jgi:hypothetical protein